jgi:hypothetical protein
VGDIGVLTSIDAGPLAAGAPAHAVSTVTVSSHAASRPAILDDSSPLCL